MTGKVYRRKRDSKQVSKKSMVKSVMKSMMKSVMKSGTIFVAETLGKTVRVEGKQLESSGSNDPIIYLRKQFLGNQSLSTILRRQVLGDDS